MALSKSIQYIPHSVPVVYHILKMLFQNFSFDMDLLLYCVFCTSDNKPILNLNFEFLLYCPACLTYLIATRFWVVVICPIIKCLTVLEFSFILFDLYLFITIFNFILNYVPIVTFWIFTYHKIWILLIIFCFIWNYLFFNMFGSVLECCELTGVSLLWPWLIQWK